MQVTKELLEKFIQNRCSRKEAELVSTYLLNNPHALDELLNDAEWESYGSNGLLDQQQSDAWFTTIQKQKSKGQLIDLKRWLQVAVAAVVVLGVSLIVYQSLKPEPKQQYPVTVVYRPNTGSAELKRKQFINNSKEPATYMLADGSEITLFRNSTVECDQPFDSTRRDLVLHGEALFKVAKDKTKPFTVYTDNFSTTALGTVFNIRAYNEQQRSSVKLISGKVVVKTLKSKTDPIYMNPGDECIFKTGERTLHLQEHKAAPAVGKQNSHYEQAVTETEDVIVFSNAPLQQVINKIRTVYHITIHIESKHLENRKFTGTHFKSESPDELLNTIAGLNNLQISKEDTVYLLRYKE